MRVPFLDLRRQAEEIEAEVLPVLREVYRGGRYVLGSELSAFEKEVADFLGVARTLGVSSGTDALFMSLLVAGVGPGDRVLTSCFSFFATVEVILRLGAEPVFVDIDPVTYNLDPGRAEEVLRKEDRRLKVFLPVHLFGRAADLGRLCEAAEEKGIAVIEDTAQSFGAVLPDGRRAGAVGRFGCFSFYPSKNLGALGDGGLIAVRGEEDAELLSRLRNHAPCTPYVHDRLGGNWRLDELQAAVLRVKLKKLPEWLRRRREIAEKYRELFLGSGLVDSGRIALPDFPTKPEEHTWNQFVVRASARDELRAFLTEAGIGTSVYYPVPLHLQPALKSLGYREGDFREAEKACHEVLALPIWPELQDEEIAFVVEKVAEFYRQRKS